MLTLSSSCGSVETKIDEEETKESSAASLTDDTSVDYSNTENSNNSNLDEIDDELSDNEEPKTAAEIYANSTPEIDYENSPLGNPIIYSARLNGYYLDITTEGFIFRYDNEAPGNGCRYAIVGDIIPEGEYYVHITNLNDYDPQSKYNRFLIVLDDYESDYLRYESWYYFVSEFQFYYDLYSYSGKNYEPNSEVDPEIMKKSIESLSEYDFDLFDHSYYGYIHDDGKLTEISLNEDGTVDGIDGSGNEIVINMEKGQQLRSRCIEFIPKDSAIFDPVAAIEKAIASEEAAKSKIEMNEKINDGEQDLHISVYYNSMDTSFYSDTDEISGSIRNNTSLDIKDVTIAFLAWDSNGLPLKISELNSGYESYVLEKTFEGINIAADDYYRDLEVSMEYNSKVRAITAIYISYTDFYGNTYENPLYKEFLEEYEGMPNK